MRRLRLDGYILALMATVGVASLLPVRGEAALALGWVTKVAIGLLFFLHGARLSRNAVIAGLAHWRLHLTVLAATFVLFPALGLLAGLAPPSLLSAPILAGVTFLCCLPSTVQSSIAFTSIARGNVAAAVCAASASNLFGIVLSPLLASLLLRSHGGFSLDSVWAIVAQLLAPFVAGQLARPWIGEWVDRRKAMLGLFDRGSIVLIVYTAFSEAVTRGIWRQVSTLEIAVLAAACLVILGVVLAATAFGSRAMGFSRPDQITIVFCGSKKSLASGVPMASILFPAGQVGLIVLPLMIFHQIQLMACAFLAQKYAERAEVSESGALSVN
ncbi:bile acid:sodium symporter family protein [Phenylobacterium montanum]|uniref:Bile acid:sodium symporter n=1 Tax=Phenylobacterium montanum TaxID=2823693 RepID=A0A975IX69_9CAUL|nr:bile acid:sodium symporter family protein [Caulobacter sp. S6]QUD90648.1 bile acid:sodium symporter [Caulobacter sp. S6]